MNLRQVLAILDIADELALTMFIAGGWGVDALVGHQTRSHNDLDVSLETAEAELLEATVADLGFELVVDWSPGRRAWQHPDGREIDVHPLDLDENGSYRLTTHDGQIFEMPPGSYVTGTIGDRPVQCLAVHKQLEYHQGYEPADKDLHDLAILQRLAGTQGDSSLIKRPQPRTRRGSS